MTLSLLSWALKLPLEKDDDDDDHPKIDGHEWSSIEKDFHEKTWDVEKYAGFHLDTDKGYEWDFTGHKGKLIVGTHDDDHLGGTHRKDVLDGRDGHDDLYGKNGDDILFGGHGDDTLKGGDDDDKLSGDGGHDKLYGGDEDDTLDGGHGEDTLKGGDDDDVLTGGGDAHEKDVFVFGRHDGDDVVTDFTPGDDILVFDDGKSHKKADYHDLDIDQKGHDTEIEFGHTDNLLKNVEAHHLSHDDFHFV